MLAEYDRQARLASVCQPGHGCDVKASTLTDYLTKAEQAAGSFSSSTAVVLTVTSTGIKSKSTILADASRSFWLDATL